ncbi:MAG: ATP-binding protein [Thermodesulfobacteriota bacterium]
MNRQYFRGIYIRAVSALMLLLLVFLAGIDYFIINIERQYRLTEVRTGLESELDEAAAFMVEPLLKFKFADIEQFIHLWSSNHQDIIRFKAITPQGLIFTDFQRETDSVSRLVLEKKVVFEGRHLMTLLMEKDYSETEAGLDQLRNFFLVASLIITLVFGVILWLIFRSLAIRPLESEISRRRQAEEELQEINLNLEEKVRARTNEVEKKNLELLDEIRERTSAEQNLSAEKERLAITLRSIADGVITTDVNGDIVLLNKVAEELTGWSQEEAAGKNVSEVFRVVGEKGGENIKNPVDMALGDGQTVSFDNSTLISRDGKEIAVADSGAPIRDKESNIVGGVLVFRDITEKLRTDDELLKMRKLESVGILAGGIAHDFNNLLMAIMGNISLAGQLVTPEDKIHRLLGGAEKASLRAKNLTQQLLTLAKGGEPIKETASIGQVIEESADFVLHGGKSDYKLEMPENLWLVDIDRGQMGQVVQNLIINARQAMPEGGTIRVSCENLESTANEYPDPLLPKQNEYVKISVTDTGVGMPENVVDKIFDPYFSTKKEGSGLGLAITHSIIKKHKGAITVNSKPGEGATFNIYLPVSKEKRVVAQSQSVAMAVPKNTKILVMDDDELVRDIAGEMLAHLGCETVMAVDGEEAIDLFKQARGKGQPFDLVIMDMTIPGGMGGREAVTIVLQEDPAAKVVVASGYSTDPVLANYQDYGFSAAIAKPFQIKELSRTIKSLLWSA